MRAREGFTLIEIIVALTMLSFALLILVGATAHLERNVRSQESRAVAVELAEERIARIQSDPEYQTLEDRYVGSDAPLEAHPSLRRTTVVDQVTDDGLDHKVFTVTVRGERIEPVSRTIVVAAP